MVSRHHARQVRYAERTHSRVASATRATNVMRDGLQRPISKPAPGLAARSALLGSILTGAHLRAQIAAQGSSRTLTRVTAPIVLMGGILTAEAARAQIVLQAGTLLWQEQFSARALVLRGKRPMGHLSAPATLTTSQLLDAAASHVMKTSSSMGTSMNA